MADTSDARDALGGRVVKRAKDGTVQPASRLKSSNPDDYLKFDEEDDPIDPITEPEEEEFEEVNETEDIEEAETAAESDDEEEEIELGADPTDDEPTPRRTKTQKSRQRHKKRKTMATKTKTRSGIPADELTRLASQYDTVRVMLTRQTVGGQWAQMRGAGNIQLPPMKIYDMPEVLEKYAGGGTYIFDVVDPENPGTKLTDTFKIALEGHPRPLPENKHIAYIEAEGKVKVVPRSDLDSPAGAGAVPAVTSGGNFIGGPVPLPADMPRPTYDTRGQLMAPPADSVPAFMRAYTPAVQWDYVHQLHARKAQEAGGDPSSAAISMYWAHQRQNDHSTILAERAKLEERVEAMRKEFDARLEARDRELEAARQKALEAEAAAERSRAESRLEALQAEIAALRTQPVKSTWNAETIAALMGPAASILTAVLSGSVERSKASQGQMNELVKVAFTKKDSSVGELIAAVAPVATPIIIKLLENRSPSALAEAEMAKVDTTMASLKMVYDMIHAEAQSQPELPKWYPAVEGLMGMVLETVQKRSLAAAPPRALGAGQPAQPQGQAQAQAARQIPAPVNPIEVLFAKFHEADQEAAAVTRMIWNNLPQDQGWHTPEWASIIFNVHYRLEPAEVAEMMADYLDHLLSFDMVPPLFAGDDTQPSIFETPKPYLEQLLQNLPIGKADPDYTREVIEATSSEIALRARERAKVEEETEEEESEAAGAEEAEERSAGDAPS